MAKQLIFDTGFTAEFSNKEITDGSIMTEDKEFIVDNARPIMLKKRGFFSRFFGTSLVPLYLLKWNVLVPAGFDVEKKFGSLEDLVEELDDKKIKSRIKKILKVDKKLAKRSYIFKELKPLELKFPKVDVKEGESVITPEILRTTHDMRFLKNFKKYAGGEKMSKKRIMDILFIGGMVVFLFIALALGGVIG